MLAEAMWYAFFSDHGRLALTLSFVVPGLVAIVAFWLSYVGKRAEISLKRRLAERGYTADEIERIVRAGRNEKDGEEEDE